MKGKIAQIIKIKKLKIVKLPIQYLNINKLYNITFYIKNIFYREEINYTSRQILHNYVKVLSGKDLLFKIIFN